ncbi:MAG TPA: amidase [Hyphomicrobiaceae bacterium]|nr:amidase [Hyphomicrobiaceae bacterium]
MNRPKPATAAETKAIIDRIEAENQRLKAFTHVLRADGIADAERADRLTKAGAGNGLVHGLPIVVKDIIDVAGVTSGCGPRAGAPPAVRDAHVVRRLRSEGAVVVAKTHTVEYAFGGYGTNITVGTPWNPWDRKVHRIPGGSSSGTGVAVGAGLVPAGLGTDTGGSVRTPASLCGCVGLKTSIGLVSRAGVAPLSQTLDTVGPLARDVTTAAYMLAAMQGHDPDDPSTDGVKPVDPLSGIEKGVNGLRLGVFQAVDLPGINPEVLADFGVAVKRLTDLGALAKPLRLPQSLDAMTRGCGTIIASEAYANYRALVDDEASKLAAPIRNRMKAARNIGAADLIQTRRERREWISALLAAIDGFDAVVLPTMAFPAIPVSDVDEAVSPLGTTRWVNYLALAGLSVPTALSKGGLPMGLQIVVRRFDDPLALRIGRAFEAARGPFPLPQ